MNWKFWTWAPEARRKERELRARIEGLEKDARDEMRAMDTILNCRAREIERLQRLLDFKQRLAGEHPTEAQILSALVVVDESTPLWRALHRMLDLLEADQKSAVCLASLNNEQRHYNAGRLAMCEDLRDALLQKWAEARRQNADGAEGQG